MLIVGFRRNGRIYIDVPASDKPQRIVVVNTTKTPTQVGFEADKSVRIVRDDAKEKVGT